MYNKRSPEHLEYIKELRREKIKTKILQVLLLISFIALWQIAADVGWIDVYITSSPVKITQTFMNLVRSNNLFMHLYVTIAETIFGFVLCTLLGVVIAIILWWFPKFAKVLDPYIVVINALPKVALGPLIIVWAGMGVKAILIMTLAISLVSSVITIYSGFCQTDEGKLTLLKSFGASKRQLLLKVILPSSYDNILSALKINLGLSWVGVIMGEFLVSKAGLGYLIMYGSNVFNLNLVMTGIILLSIAAAFMYFAVIALEKRVGRFFKS
jgi:NitT/TauT family transport system permease protein